MYRVFSVKFSGHWPVGACAVVVATNEAEAEEMFRAEWTTRSSSSPNPVEVAEVDTSHESVTVLLDGNY